MGKRQTNVKQPDNQQRQADANVAIVMGHGLYWIVKTVVYIPVVFIKTTAKAVGITKD